MENRVSTIIEDFEVGDRAYLMTGFKIQLGDVLYVDSEILEIGMDDGTVERFSPEEILDSHLKHRQVGKPLNLGMVHEGCLISKNADPDRIYAEIETYLPGQELAFRPQGYRITTVVQEKQFGSTLEEQMIFWEIEE